MKEQATGGLWSEGEHLARTVRKRYAVNQRERQLFGRRLRTGGTGRDEGTELP